jgi:hypothetical protein
MGKSILRWQPHKDGGFVGTVIRDGARLDPIFDDEESCLIARLRNEAGKLHPDYVGFDGAINRFRQFFPNGFQDRQADAQERHYKERAAANLQSAVTIEEAHHADSAIAARAAASGIQTNMLSVFEAARLNDVLRGETGAEFVRGAAIFVGGDTEAGIARMTAAITPHGRVSWPLLTYLPFLWDHQQHMFLKPTVTLSFADRVGDQFADLYDAEANAGTYLALLDLVETTRRQIASLKPRDNLDVQSFIWVVGEYRPGDVPNVGE